MGRLIGVFPGCTLEGTFSHTVAYIFVFQGLNKRELLKEILPYFSENIKRLQRLYTEFQEQLDAVESVT